MRQCYLCGSTCNIEEHHLLLGSRRKKADEYGLVVDLCHDCHSEAHDRNSELLNELRQEGQRRFEAQGHSRKEFMREFGRNYLD